MTTPTWTYRSSLPGAVWPAIPGQESAGLLALQFQLEQSQWLAPQRLRELQFRQLEALLRHAHDTVPYHRERWRGLYDPGRALAPDGYSRVPLMNRRDIQSQGEKLLSQRVPAEHGRVMKGETSGSTGSPITFYSTDLSQFYWNGCTLRDHFWHRRDFSGKLAVIRKGVPQATLPSWGLPMELVFQTGPGATLDLGADIDTQLEWLQREQPDYLLSYPSNIAELARCSIEQGIRLARLREVRAIGEAMAPQTRKLCREAWDVPLTDAYSSQEAGYLALQCPGHEHYHVQSESVMLEILDEQGAACAPGETGRVVLTTLHNFAMPLIRYEIGDYAEAGAPCPCGRGLPVITRILGRQRNMLTLPDGRRRWPSFPSEKWSYAAPVRQLQIIQRTRERIEIRVVPERALSDGERARFIGAMQDCLGHAFILDLREVAEIPRSASLKYEDFISEIAI